MQKYVFSILHNLLLEVKEYKKYENLDKIRAILNNEISSINCTGVTVNDSSTASTFYGIIVYPNLMNSYAIEIQRQAIDLFSPQELAALIIHDISHNVLSTTVFERMKLAIIKACRMTNMKIVDIQYNADKRMSDLACLDIANRTFKNKIVPGTEMYEPDRLLVDMSITDQFNSAVDKMATLDSLNLSLPDYQDICDTHMGLRLVKMVREKLRGIYKTYTELSNFVQTEYDTKVLPTYPSPYTQSCEGDTPSLYTLLNNEELKPFELSMLQEGVVQGIQRHGQSETATILIESTFGNGKITYSALQRELDILNFKIESIGSNYERLAILDRIYDNIFALETYLDKVKDDQIIWDYLKKFIGLTGVLKDAKVAKRKYGVFVETPDGYQG